ncbi:hypothetical protein FRC17_001021 [Serendipita sp. 399]|nr:hypothetical protein FRC17_001021 [Serendipita sp. 399]
MPPTTPAFETYGSPAIEEGKSCPTVYPGSGMPDRDTGIDWELVPNDDGILDEAGDGVAAPAEAKASLGGLDGRELPDSTEGWRPKVRPIKNNLASPAADFLVKEKSIVMGM